MSNPLSLPDSGFTFQSDTPHPVEQMLQRLNQMTHLRMEARARELEAAQRAETGSVNRCPECGAVLQPAATVTPAANRLEADLARAMDLVHKATTKQP